MKKKNLLPMKLQFFADGDGNEGNPPDPQLGSDSKDVGGGANGKYTDEQVDEIVKKKKAAWAKEMEDKANEAQRLGQMSEAEKQKELIKQEQERANGLEREINSYKMRDTAREMLNEVGVSALDSDLDLIVTPDADSTKSNVNQLADFAKRVKADVQKEFLSGDHIKQSSNKLNDAGTRGAQLAQTQVDVSKRENPYFKS